MFRVERRGDALFVPPFNTRLLLRGAEGWERIGPKLFPRFAGLTLVEAEKDMFAALPVAAAARRGAAAAAAGGDGGGGGRAGLNRGPADPPTTSTDLHRVCCQENLHEAHDVYKLLILYTSRPSRADQHRHRRRVAGRGPARHRPADQEGDGRGGAARLLVRLKEQEEILGLAGKVRWEGDLDRSRRGRNAG